MVVYLICLGWWSHSGTSSHVCHCVGCRIGCQLLLQRLPDTGHPRSGAVHRSSWLLANENGDGAWERKQGPTPGSRQCTHGPILLLSRSRYVWHCCDGLCLQNACLFLLRRSFFEADPYMSCYELQHLYVYGTRQKSDWFGIPCSLYIYTVSLTAGQLYTFSQTIHNMLHTAASSLGGWLLPVCVPNLPYHR